MRSKDLSIPEPCPADWNVMKGGDARRFCSRCDKHVHNLSALTERAAREVLALAPRMRLCVRYEADRQGKVRFAPEPPVMLRRSRGGPVLVAGLAGSLLAACVTSVEGGHAPDGGVDAGQYAQTVDDYGFAGAGPWDQPTSVREALMGDIALPARAPAPPVAEEKDPPALEADDDGATDEEDANDGWRVRMGRSVRVPQWRKEPVALPRDELVRTMGMYALPPELEEASAEPEASDEDEADDDWLQDVLGKRAEDLGATMGEPMLVEDDANDE